MKSAWLVTTWYNGRQVGNASQHSSRLGAWRWIAWTTEIIPGARFTVETVGGAK